MTDENVSTMTTEELYLVRERNTPLADAVNAEIVARSWGDPVEELLTNLTDWLVEVLPVALDNWPERGLAYALPMLATDLHGRLTYRFEQLVLQAEKTWPVTASVFYIPFPLGREFGYYKLSFALGARTDGATKDKQIDQLNRLSRLDKARGIPVKIKALA